MLLVGVQIRLVSEIFGEHCPHLTADFCTVCLELEAAREEIAALRGQQLTFEDRP